MAPPTRKEWAEMLLGLNPMVRPMIAVAVWRESVMSHDRMLQWHWVMS